MGFGLSVILLIGLRFVGIFLAPALARLAHRPWLGLRFVAPPGAMEAVAWVCEFCKGASGKPQASENSRRCTSNKKPWNCRDALTEARKREREAQGSGVGVSKTTVLQSAVSGRASARVASTVAAIGKRGRPGCCFVETPRSRV